MEINGVAHVYLTVGNFALAREFYGKLLPFLGLRAVLDTESNYYCVGGRTAVGIMAADSNHKGERFEQKRTGLHHVCFRARERSEIDEAFEFLKSIGATIVHGPQDDRWAPGYYSVLFEDPDGIRLEINHVPGKGLFGTAEARLGAT